MHRPDAPHTQVHAQDQEAELAALLNTLYSFHYAEIDLSLDRTYRFLSHLGNPHLRLPKVVHIAGTNGKGSTLATLRALLEASGHSVHTYTSPHLVHPTERIVLAGETISTAALYSLLKECIELNNNEPITFFELFTCAAFLEFSRVSADYLLLEVGMGGRYDTTNVVPDPVATIITTVSYDHVSFLGDTLEKIAYEKAGIIKPGVPCIVGHQIDAEIVYDVIRKQSRHLSPEPPLYFFGAEWASAPKAGRMMFRYENDSIDVQRPALSGQHQIWNAGAALAAFRIIAPDHFKPGILPTAMANITWPGRLQKLTAHPYNAIVPDGWDIVIDGGHNDSAGLVLADQAKAWENSDGMPLHLVVAMVDRKDAAAFLTPLASCTSSLTLTAIPDEPSSYDIDMLAGIAERVGFKNIYRVGTPEDAVKNIAQNHLGSGKSRVLITGSLFLMGAILKQRALTV